MKTRAPEGDKAMPLRIRGRNMEQFEEKSHNIGQKSIRVLHNNKIGRDNTDTLYTQ
jgi:hypothetical protein